MAIRVILVVLGLASGVLLAIAATFLGVFGSTAPSQRADAKPLPPPPVMIVVAARALPTGTLITLQDLRFAPVPADRQTAADFVRVDAPAPKEQMTADRAVFGEIAGAVSRTRFNEGDPIVRGQMVKPGDAGFLAAVLQPGMRAITMSVNIVTGNAGLLTPGDHIDVVLVQTFAEREADPGLRSVAETIVSDLRVIAVDQRLRAGPEPTKDARPAQTVTLEVTALQAEKIDVGAKMGELALAIRGVRTDGEPSDEDDGVLAAVPAAVWAKDLSPAIAGMRPTSRAPIPASAPVAAKREDRVAVKPQLNIYRGDKMESVPQ
jgi:pilus assembly protein CpaB